MTALLSAPAEPKNSDDTTGQHLPAGVASYASQIGWSLVALFVGFAGEQVWTASLGVPGANLVAMLLVLGGLLGVWFSWMRKGDLPIWAQLALLGGLVLGVSYQAALSWLFDPSYGTDAVAFDQYAAWLTLHGHNPYTTSMEPSLRVFQVPVGFHTFRLDGSAVTALSYPAGSFVLYLPLLALGVNTQAANIVDLFFWFAGIFLLWKLLPRDACWVAGLIGGAFLYVGFVVGGLTDALFVPFVLLAVYRWDTFADPANTSRWRWLGPLSLGMAVSIKQTPWFLVPYLLLGLVFEARAYGVSPFRVVAKYFSVVAAVFAVVNGPFMVADPAAWLRGLLVPFVDGTIPDGQGLINLAIFEHFGGGNLKGFTVLGVGLVLLSLFAFTLKYTHLKRAFVPLIAISFFFPTRSFGSYLFMLIPAALVAATTVAPAAGNPIPVLARYAKPLLGIGLAGLLVLAGVTLSTPAPLTLTIIGTRSTGQLQTLNEITVSITNRTGRSLHPHFTVNAVGHVTTFWYSRDRSGAQVTLAPHEHLTVTLEAPNTASMPGLSAQLLVEAFTAVPATVSVSARYQVSPINTRILQDSFDKPVPVGQPVTMTVQAQDEYGAPVRRSGIQVTLGQTVYGEDALYAGEASVNGHAEGFSPVTVLTDNQGQATFTIIGVQAQPDPVFFQAVIQGNGQVPHGYSNQVSIQFTASK